MALLAEPAAAETITIGVTGTSEYSGVLPISYNDDGTPILDSWDIIGDFGHHHHNSARRRPRIGRLDNRPFSWTTTVAQQLRAANLLRMGHHRRR